MVMDSWILLPPTSAHRRRSLYPCVSTSYATISRHPLSGWTSIVSRSGRRRGSCAYWRSDAQSAQYGRIGHRPPGDGEVYRRQVRSPVEPGRFGRNHQRIDAVSRKGCEGVAVLSQVRSAVGDVSALPAPISLAGRASSVLSEIMGRSLYRHGGAAFQAAMTAFQRACLPEHKSHSLPKD